MNVGTELAEKGILEKYNVKVLGTSVEAIERADNRDLFRKIMIDNGIHICGGGSLLRGMDTVLANATGLIVQTVEDPLSCVARGTSVYLENLELWKDTMDHNEYRWE